MGGTVTVFDPRSPDATKLPVCDTVRFTARSDAGAGVAVTVNVASPPSVTAAPAVMLTTGSDCARACPAGRIRASPTSNQAGAGHAGARPQRASRRRKPVGPRPEASERQNAAHAIGPKNEGARRTGPRSSAGGRELLWTGRSVGFVIGFRSSPSAATKIGTALLAKTRFLAGGNPGRSRHAREAGGCSARTTHARDRGSAGAAPRRCATPRPPVEAAGCARRQPGRCPRRGGTCGTECRHSGACLSALIGKGVREAHSEQTEGSGLRPRERGGSDLPAAARGALRRSSELVRLEVTDCGRTWRARRRGRRCSGGADAHAGGAMLYPPTAPLLTHAHSRRALGQPWQTAAIVPTRWGGDSRSPQANRDREIR